MARIGYNPPRQQSLEPGDSKAGPCVQLQGPQVTGFICQVCLFVVDRYLIEDGPDVQESSMTTCSDSSIPTDGLCFVTKNNNKIVSK